MVIENSIPNEDIIRLAEKEEPRFLNILLRDKDCLMDAVSFGIKPSERGKPSHFLNPKNRFLFAMIHKNFIKYGTLLTRSAVDNIIDMQEFGTDEEKASNKGYWDKVWNRHDIALEDYGLLRDHINDRYVLWQFFEMWKGGDRIIKSTVDHTSLINKFLIGVNKIDNIDPNSYSLTMGIEEGVDAAIKYITHRRENPNEVDGVMSGIGKIDRIYNGFKRGSYTVVSGTINGGKTTFMMNMAFNMAKAGYNVAYVSLEKEAELFFRRILSLHASTDYNRIKRGGKEKWGLTDYWYNRLKEARDDINQNIKPYFDCLQFVQKTKLTKILSEVDKIRARKKLDALFVDYLQVIGTETQHIGRADLDLADIHSRLQAYGKENNFVTVTALQLKSASSKAIREKARKVTSESDLQSVQINTEDYSGSQMIIADADNGIGVTLNGDNPPTKMFVSISKARDDESLRSMALDFDGRIGRVCDPQIDPSKIKSAADLLYNENIKEEDLASEDNLFDSVAPSMDENKESEESKSEDIQEELFEGEKDAISDSSENAVADLKQEDVVQEPFGEEEQTLDDFENELGDIG